MHTWSYRLHLTSQEWVGVGRSRPWPATHTGVCVDRTPGHRELTKGREARVGSSDGDRKGPGRVRIACRLHTTPYGKERRTVGVQSAVADHVADAHNQGCAVAVHRAWGADREWARRGVQARVRAT
ncbi:hypothetical protein V6N13_113997 [Hibiscus sabdariffa]